ncbi:hypothetical protein [Pararhizobium sp. IMCC21322]|uniref:hypothetical protein n=1 Tax=Pararhizobium sp. IMCC21322 TaxID=3067903 RepID=UPI002741C889|nr:hypothetical protein [Pararhizobium sp. IMCC21322]
MKFKKTFFAAACLAILPLSLTTTHDARASESVQRALESLAPSVRFVQSAGQWRGPNGQIGTHRIVLLANPDETQSLYIQWVPLNKGGQSTAPYALEIDEISKLNQEIIGVSAQVGVRGELSVYLEAEPTDDPNVPYGYELFLKDRNTYSFGGASN